MRRPKLAILLAGGLLVALSLPALGMHTKQSGFEALPPGLAVVADLRAVQTAFPSDADPATVVVKAADVTAPEVQQGIARPQQATAKGDPQVVGPITQEVNRDHTVTRLDVALAGRRHSDAASAGRPEAPARGPAAGDAGKVDGVVREVTGLGRRRRPTSTA